MEGGLFRVWPLQGTKGGGGGLGGYRGTPAYFNLALILGLLNTLNFLLQLAVPSGKPTPPLAPPPLRSPVTWH